MDNEGYPTEEYLTFIRHYVPSEELPLMDFIQRYLIGGWHYRNWGVRLGRRYRGKRKLILHTGGWSGNEEIIREVLVNFYLTHGKMRYVMWKTGGHYYFEIND